MLSAVLIRILFSLWWSISIGFRDTTAFTTTTRRTTTTTLSFFYHGLQRSSVTTISLHSTTKQQQQQQESSSSSSSSSSPANNGQRVSSNKDEEQQPPARSLYDVLGTTPTASLDELKSQYKALARVQHPDAAGKDGRDTTESFSEIAAAYRLLKDPVQRRQYDRSLRAASLSNSIWKSIDEASLVPRTVSLLEDIALPLFRKTTATTLAGMQAATAKTSSSSGSRKTGSAKDSNDKNNNGNGWWQRVFQAATTASRSMDVIELREKASVLEEEAVREYEAAVALQQTIQEVVRQRLHVAVATPGTILTSEEARLLNATVNVLEPLQRVEADWQQVLDADEAAQGALRTVTQNRIQAENAVLRAEQRKIEAQQAYERAIVEARNKTMVLESAMAAENGAKAVAEKSTAAVERQREVVIEQSEQVRTALLPIVQPTVPANATAVRELRLTERELADAATKMERQAAELLARSNQMKKRAMVLERMNAQQAASSSQQEQQR